MTEHALTEAAALDESAFASALADATQSLQDRPADGAGGLDGELGARIGEVARLAQEQRALRRVATLVASEASPERVFTAVSEECARVLDVSASAVFRYEGDDTATVVGRHDRDGIPAFNAPDERYEPAVEATAYFVVAEG